MDEGIPQFADKNSTDQRMAALEQRLKAAEDELASWRNLTIDPASGGGTITMGGNSVTLRINSLTNDSAKMP